MPIQSKKRKIGKKYGGGEQVFFKLYFKKILIFMNMDTFLPNNLVEKIFLAINKHASLKSIITQLQNNGSILSLIEQNIAEWIANPANALLANLLKYNCKDISNILTIINTQNGKEMQNFINTSTSSITYKIPNNPLPNFKDIFMNYNDGLINSLSVSIINVLNQNFTDFSILLHTLSQINSLYNDAIVSKIAYKIAYDLWFTDLDKGISNEKLYKNLLKHVDELFTIENEKFIYIDILDRGGAELIKKLLATNQHQKGGGFPESWKQYLQKVANQANNVRQNIQTQAIKTGKYIQHTHGIVSSAAAFAAQNTSNLAEIRKLYQIFTNIRNELQNIKNELQKIQNTQTKLK
jgi:hypothetical protein